MSKNRDPGDDTIPPLEEDSLPSQPQTTEIPNHPILQETREAEASELNESTVRSGPMVKGKWAGRLRQRKSRSHARAKDGRKVKTRKTRVASLRDANLSAPRSVCQGQNSSDGNRQQKNSTPDRMVLVSWLPRFLSWLVEKYSLTLPEWRYGGYTAVVLFFLFLLCSLHRFPS